MRVLVCGGRNYRDREAVFRALDRLHAKRGIAFLMQGAADGADYLAWQWAQERGVEVGSFAADWQGEGRAAGPRRNQRMLDEGRPDGVVAFPGGRGTADMVRRAEQNRVPVWRPVPPGR
jgi:YspA, cpYpsA-related SLOG family